MNRRTDHSARPGRALEELRTRSLVDTAVESGGISLQSFISANPRQRRAGLLGWVTMKIGPFVVDGVALRRTTDGRLAFSYPVRTGSRGQRFAIIRPYDEASRRQIETDLLVQLGLELEQEEAR